jgi:uncharacterized protein
VVFIFTLKRQGAVALVRRYQHGAALHRLARCRHQPTCPICAIEAMERYGLLLGGMRAVRPILRCPPPLAGITNRTRGHVIQRRRRGPMVIRHPPGSGRMSTPSGSNRSYGSTKTSSSGRGIVRRSRRRGVGGTGGGALGSVLGSRVRTASRSASPWGTVAPHVSHVRPPLFTASHTRQRQTALTRQPGPSACARASRPGRRPRELTRLCSGTSARSGALCRAAMWAPSASEE